MAYRQKENAKLYRADPGDSGCRPACQLVCGIPRLKSAKGIHLPESKEEGSEGSERRHVRFEASI